MRFGRPAEVLRRAWQAAYRVYAVRGGVRLGRRVHLGIGTILWASRSLVVGNDVYVGKYCTLEVDGRVGNHVLIGNSVGIIGRDDHESQAVGRYIDDAPWIGDPSFNRIGKRLEVDIGDDVWIGYGAVILSGVSIGRGAVIGAGSIVTKDIPEYAIAAGNPARIIGARFSREMIARHEKALYEPS